MKNKLQFLLFLGLFSLLHKHLQAAQQSIDPQRSVNLTVNVTGNGNAANAATAESTSFSSNVCKQYTVDHKIDFGVLSGLSDLFLKSQSLCGSAQQAVQFPFGVEKYKLIALSLLSTYAVIAYKLCQVHELIHSQQAWCNWKEVVDLSHLVSSPYEDTIKQLHLDIAKKYFSIQLKEPGQNAHMLFLKDVQEEIDLLTNYLWLCSGIKMLHCAYCFSLKDVSVIQEKLARLNFMIDVFIKWQVKYFA